MNKVFLTTDIHDLEIVSMIQEASKEYPISLKEINYHDLIYRANKYNETVEADAVISRDSYVIKSCVSSHLIPIWVSNSIDESDELNQLYKKHSIMKVTDYDSLIKYIKIISTEAFHIRPVKETDGFKYLQERNIFTHVLDQLTIDSWVWSDRKYGHYLHIDNGYLSDHVICWRSPGSTKGEITFNEDFIITGIHIFEHARKIYVENAEEVLSRYIGRKIIIDER